MAKRNNKVASEEISRSVTLILDRLGRSGESGTKDTPRRVTRFLQEFCKPRPINMTVFEEPRADEMVLVGPISFASLCEHHMLPFFGEAFVAYIPSMTEEASGDKSLYRLAGISKLARAVEHFSAGLNNQERITARVGHFLSRPPLDPVGVAVLMRAQHTCMTIRGVRQPCACTTTQFFSGPFKTDAGTRSEFLSHCRMSNKS